MRLTLANRRYRRARQLISQCLQETVAVSLVGLETHSLGPFVPRIDEQDSATRRLITHRLDRDAKPPRERLRRRVDENDRLTATARRVVPTSEESSQVRVRRPVSLHQATAFGVVVDLQIGRRHAEPEV